MDLFERTISMKAKENGDGISVEGHLSDSYHEMTLKAEFTHPDLVLTKIEGKFIRYPHDECLVGEKTLKNVLGLKAGRELFQKIEKAYGGPRGCVHLLNLMYQAGLAAVQARFAKSKDYAPPDLDKMPKPRRIKLYLAFQPGMRDSCIAWSNESPMVRAADSLKD